MSEMLQKFSQEHEDMFDMSSYGDFKVLLCQVNFLATWHMYLFVKKGNISKDREDDAAIISVDDLANYLEKKR